MSIESPNISTGEEKEKEDMRYRVLKLRGKMYDLAYGEKAYREEIEKDGVKKELIDKIADRDSTKELEKLELIKEGYKDGLTGLWNRKALKEQIPTIIEGIKRKNGNYSLLMIDVDDFKTINDIYGHQIGDNVLVDLAIAIKENARKSDHVFRYGGEEFVVFLPDTDPKKAFEIAERIRRYIKEMDIISGNGKERGITINKTVSTGIFDGKSLKNFNSDIYAGDSNMILKELIGGADKAMYLAKENGKNRTIDYAGVKIEADKLFEKRANNGNNVTK